MAMSTGRVSGQPQGSAGVLRARAGQLLHQGAQLTAAVFFNLEDLDFFE